MKYIRYKEIGFVVWPAIGELWHKSMHKRMMEEAPWLTIMSAGFVRFSGAEVICYGESSSLGVGSRDDDGAALKWQIAGLPYEVNQVSGNNKVTMIQEEEVSGAR